MKVLTVSAAKTRLGRVIDQVIKTHEPVVIPRGQKHVVIMPYSLPSPEELELAAVFREVDKGRAPVEEDASTVEAIREEIQKYRAEKPPCSTRMSLSRPPPRRPALRADALSCWRGGDSNWQLPARH